MKLTIPPVDKQAHFWAGMAICLALASLLGNPVIAAVLTVIVATAREQFGNKDLADFAWTALGALTAELIVFVGVIV